MVKISDNVGSVLSGSSVSIFMQEKSRGVLKNEGYKESLLGEPQNYDNPGLNFGSSDEKYIEYNGYHKVGTNNIGYNSLIDEDKITLDESIIKRLHKNRFYREVVSFVSYDKKMK